MRRSIRLAQLLALVAVCLCVLVPPVVAQVCLRQMNIPEWQGDEYEGYRHVAVADGYAIATFCDYDTGEGVLRVIDVRTPSEPVEVGSLEMCAGDLVVSGRYAYVDRWDRAVSPEEFLDIRVIDVSDPASPTEVASIEGVGRIGAVADGYGYTFDPDVGIWVLDVTDPTLPTEVGVLASASFCAKCTMNGLAVSGGYAHVAGGSDYGGYLHVIDIRDPAWPVHVASVRVAVAPWVQAGQVAISGNYAYVGEKGPPGSDAFYVVDVSNPSQPVVVHRVRSEGSPIALAESGHFLYAIFYIFQGGWQALVVHDVSDPTEPLRVEGFSQVNFRIGDDVVPRDFYFSDLCLWGRYVYTVGRGAYGGLVAFDGRDCRYRQMPLAVE